jgi:superfamily II DNA or RNA helicase
VCVDQQHARKIALELTPISGEKPVVVLSDDRGASKKIKDFAESSAPWIIACNMVSEGVDIPRLRIGVYATTVRTKMYFRQFLGRIVRRQAGVTGTQIAYMYLPADPWLQHLAEEVEQETRHALRKRESEFEDNDRVRRKSDERDDRPSWSAVSSINSGLDAVVVHGNQLSFLPSAAPTEVQELIEREIMVQRESSLSRSETKQQLCNEIKRMVSVLNKRSGKPHSSIHLTLNRTQRVQSQIHCTEQQLRARIKLLEEMVYSRKSC